MDKVLIAADGEEEAGRATAYLIDRSAKSDAAEFVIVTVCTSNQPAAEASWADRGRRAAAVEGARPWLEYAGLTYEFSKKAGDFAAVVNDYLADHEFAEVVLISSRLNRPRFLGKLFMLGRSKRLSQIHKPGGTKLTVLMQSANQQRH